MTGTVVAVIIIVVALAYLIRSMYKKRGKPCEAAQASSPQCGQGRCAMCLGDRDAHEDAREDSGKDVREDSDKERP